MRGSFVSSIQAERRLCLIKAALSVFLYIPVKLEIFEFNISVTIGF
jgi:hypothetical protein